MYGTQIKKKCPECGQKTTVQWRQIHGMRMLIEIDGKLYYEVKCSNCGWYWHIEKKKG
jgi:predicted nucleic-acid-binding Zn-ribbon protein